MKFLVCGTAMTLANDGRPAVSALRTRSPTATSEIAILSPDARRRLSVPAKQEVRERIAGIVSGMVSLVPESFMLTELSIVYPIANTTDRFPQLSRLTLFLSTMLKSVTSFMLAQPETECVPVPKENAYSCNTS